MSLLININTNEYESIFQAPKAGDESVYADNIAISPTVHQRQLR